VIGINEHGIVKLLRWNHWWGCWCVECTV